VRDRGREERGEGKETREDEIRERGMEGERRVVQTIVLNMGDKDSRQYIIGYVIPNAWMYNPGGCYSPRFNSDFGVHWA